VVRDLGVGTYLDHARNQLNGTVISAAHKGFLQRDNGSLLWGVDVRSEVIEDRLSEWTMVDSADYSVPQSGVGEDLTLSYSLKSKLNMESIRTGAYMQDTWKWGSGQGGEWSLTAGVRAQYWTYNGQTV
jgi:outer membrane receptor protein involved in Fe transport